MSNAQTQNVTVEMNPSLGGTVDGHYISKWKSQEALYDYVTALEVGQYGWIVADNVSLHFKVTKIGAIFTNAKFTEGDKYWVARHTGQKLADILLQTHN